MFRRSIPILSKKAPSRTIVRDPRKNRAAVSQLVEQQENEIANQSNDNSGPVQPFEPSTQNQQSLGSTLGSYALAGVGMSMGFALVRVVFGV